MNCQSDYSGFIKQDGCLAFCLVRIAEKKVGQELTHLKLADLIYVLHYKVPCSYDNTKPVLSDEDDVTAPGIFVHDHAEVINQALLFMNILDLKCKYIGRFYTKAEEARGKKSFGTYIDADEMILQIQTENSGHFRMFDYDPWPGTVAKYIKSIRYYRWV